MIKLSYFLTSALLILNTIVFSCTVFANEHGRLTITPEICVVNKGENECKTILKVNYEAIQKGNYCLSINEISITRCYNNTKAFSLSLDFASAKPVTVYIYDQVKQQTLVKKVLEVVIFKPKTRHRRNFGWNFL